MPGLSKINNGIEISIEDRIKGVIYGHAIGDAIGLGTEFLSKRQIKLFYPNGYSAYDQMIQDKHRFRWQKGEWTDDTDQMLCILKSILKNKQIIETDIAKNIYEWAYTGGRGLGMTVKNVITSPNFLLDPHGIAEKFWINSGQDLAANGAVMRTSVLGILNYSDFEKVKVNTERVAKITHFDPRCVGSCVAVSYAISQILNGETDYRKITEKAIDITKIYDVRIKDFLLLAFENNTDKFELDEPKSIGYTLKALGAGFWAIQQNDFKNAIVEIVNQGGDADTNAAVAGGMLGAKFGFSGLPLDWLDGLIGKEKLDIMINELITLVVI